MSFFNRFFRRSRPAPAVVTDIPRPVPQPLQETAVVSQAHGFNVETRRFFHNTPSFQCYTSWFAHWDGWISAGHCITDAGGHTASFATGELQSWPDGLDAALVGCTLPAQRPPDPHIGQDLTILGFPAGCRTMETRTARTYFERGGGQWIAHIFDPDEPVVVGMSGGPVIDVATGQPVGITITRNSPADLNSDRDPDESADFIALSVVWDALNRQAAGNA